MSNLQLPSNLRRCLIAAGLFHVLATIAIFLSGHFRLLPNTFDTYGTGISFAIDAATYRSLVAEMAGALHSSGLAAWIALPAPLHCRIYSLSFAVLGPIVGYNILAAEPLNLSYYLGILIVVYRLGREIFNPQAGLLAAVIVAIWPSILIHTTQLIRDPLAILCMLSLLFVMTVVLNRTLSWRQGVLAGFVTVALVTIFWLTRGNMWNIVLASNVILAVLLIIRMLREQAFLVGNVILVLLMASAILLVPTRIESTTRPFGKPISPLVALPSASHPAPTLGLWSRLTTEIRARRAGFHVYSAQGSNIDSEVTLNSPADVLRYLPRAAVIGFCAPFPKMWVQASANGRAGRIISGVETLAMYLLYLPAAVCLWRERRRLAVWLIFCVTTVGMVALGLVVVNAGALYRVRYVFWILIIVLAGQGMLLLAKKTRSS
jgi:4-amino-4-deoxy-L-arabinose transferase-like glycosyltransferase